MTKQDDKPELALLRSIDGKVDALTGAVKSIERRAAVAGAVSGAVSGSLAGGLVSMAILYIKIKLGW